jgi:hypothetical protein
VTNAIAALTDLAQSFYKGEISVSQPRIPLISTGDAVLDGFQRIAEKQPSEPKLDATVDALKQDSDLASALRTPNQFGVMIMREGGGSRETFRGIVSSLLLCALRRSYVFGTQLSEAEFVAQVVTNFSQLQKAVQGKRVHVERITGFSGVGLQPRDKIKLPWGTFQPAPDASGHFIPVSFNLPKTTALLVKTQLAPIKFSDAPEPEMLPLPGNRVEQAERIRSLVALSFALSTVDGNLCAPLATFELVLYPFGSGLGWSTMPWFFPTIRPVAEPSRSEIAQAELWSRTLNEHEAENLRLAGRRIVSAIAQRADTVDSLIDAVTAWESMVGTRNETSFRVTAALAKLLETNAGNRFAFRKELDGIYGLRSRIVHGDHFKPSDVAAASKRAIEVGLRALSALYQKPKEWLKATSTERADKLILE